MKDELPERNTTSKLPNLEEFKAGLTRLLNKHNQEFESGTPDFILAEYLCECLAGWNRAAKMRESWYRPPAPTAPAVTMTMIDTQRVPAPTPLCGVITPVDVAKRNNPPAPEAVK